MSKPFTYIKMPKDLMPVSMEDILDAYPWPPNEQGEKYSYFAHYRFPIERVSQEFKNILAHTNTIISHAEIFFRPGVGDEFDAFIHTDGHKILESLAKINFIISDSSNIMKWFVPIVPVTEEHVKITKVGTKYLNFEPEEVELIDEADLQGLYVVNAGIPHSVSMQSGSVKSPRICISLVPKDNETKKNLGCDDAYLKLLYGFAKEGYADLDFFKQEFERINSAYKTTNSVK